MGGTELGWDGWVPRGAAVEADATRCLPRGQVLYPRPSLGSFFAVVSGSVVCDASGVCELCGALVLRPLRPLLRPCAAKFVASPSAVGPSNRSEGGQPKPCAGQTSRWTVQ